MTDRRERESYTRMILTMEFADFSIYMCVYLNGAVTKVKIDVIRKFKHANSYQLLKIT